MVNSVIRHQQSITADNRQSMLYEQIWRYVRLLISHCLVTKQTFGCAWWNRLWTQPLQLELPSCWIPTTRSLLRLLLLQISAERPQGADQHLRQVLLHEGTDKTDALRLFLHFRCMLQPDRVGILPACEIYSISYDDRSGHSSLYRRGFCTLTCSLCSLDFVLQQGELRLSIF